MDPQSVVLQMQGAGDSQPGISALSRLDRVNVHLEINEGMTGFEKKTFRICNTHDQQFLYAVEDSNSCYKFLCGLTRPFSLYIMDNNNKPIMSLHRPFRCQASPLWPYYLQEMDIMSPPGMSLGGIKQLWTPWKPKFEVHDSQQQPLFHILGECCFRCPYGDKYFKVVDAHNGSDIGEIIKHWGGCVEMQCGGNDFSVSFPIFLDLTKKTLLLGASFLIDYNFFEAEYE